MIAPKHIVVATDFGEAAHAAFRYGLGFARTYAAVLHVAHVVDDLTAHAAVSMATSPIDMGTVQVTMEDEARQLMTEFVNSEDISGVEVRTEILRARHPGRSILRFCEGVAADLILVGTHGRGAMAEFFLGSVAQEIVRHATCPVLVVRSHERDFLKPDALTVPESRIIAKQS